MKKKIIIPTLVLTAFLAVGMLSSEIYSHSNIPIHKLANQYEIDELEVSGIIDAIKDEYETNKNAIFSDWLQKLLDDGKINEQQKVAIMDKREEYKALRESLRDMNDKEKISAIRYFKSDINIWSSKWNIDLNLLNPKNNNYLALQDLGYGLGNL